MIELAPEQSTVLEDQLRLVEKIESDCAILLAAFLRGEEIDMVNSPVPNHTTRISDLRKGKYDGNEWDIKQAKVEGKNYNRYWL